jgi:hypothetical protein
MLKYFENCYWKFILTVKLFNFLMVNICTVTMVLDILLLQLHLYVQVITLTVKVLKSTQ